MKGRELLDAVNILAGTASTPDFSTGNTLPIAAVPFGLTHWTLQTATNPRWFFHSDHPKFQGFRATHQPSPWMGDYGQLVIMPLGKAPRLDPEGRSSHYKRNLTPYSLSVDLTRYGIQATLRPTRTCAHIACESESDLWLVIEGTLDKTEISIHGKQVQVKSKVSSGGTMENFGCYYVIQIENGFEVLEHATHRVTLACKTRNAQVEVGTSFISFDQAQTNLNKERADWDFAQRAWEKTFSGHQVESKQVRDEQTFANCLYRANLFPRESHEYSASGEAIHYSFFNGSIVTGEAVTDNGFWDTYRTVYPWYNLVNPSRSAIAINGWNGAHAEGGWYPQWASPGYRSCMVGTHIDSVIADAVVKGVGGFDIQTCLTGMLKHATEVGHPNGAYGRLGIEDYLANGFVAEETVEGAVARSLDYAYDDFCISQVARHLGDSITTDQYAQASGNYVKSFDPGVGFMRARHKDGSWAHFREFEWGGPYVEGGAWQSSFAVQHDPVGLANLFGGPEHLLTKLRQLMVTPPKFEIGHYGFEIHEMTEMAAVDFGQYAQSNQPVHHVLYLFHEFGAAAEGASYLHRVMRELYTPTLFPGDEDNGEMACWYLWSSLGLFPFCPGKPEYTTSKPLFEYSKTTLESGAEVEITSGNGKTGDKIPHSELAKGCQLIL